MCRKVADINRVSLVSVWLSPYGLRLPEEMQRNPACIFLHIVSSGDGVLRHRYRLWDITTLRYLCGRFSSSLDAFPFLNVAIVAPTGTNITFN